MRDAVHRRARAAREGDRCLHPGLPPRAIASKGLQEVIETAHELAHDMRPPHAER